MFVQFDFNFFALDCNLPYHYFSVAEFGRLKNWMAQYRSMALDMEIWMTTENTCFSSFFWGKIVAAQQKRTKSLLYSLPFFLLVLENNLCLLNLSSMDSWSNYSDHTSPQKGSVLVSGNGKSGYSGISGWLVKYDSIWPGPMIIYNLLLMVQKSQCQPPFVKPYDHTAGVNYQTLVNINQMKVDSQSMSLSWRYS